MPSGPWGPYLAVEGQGLVSGEEPVVGGVLRQLEQAAGGGQQRACGGRRDRQQGVGQLEGVGVAAREDVAVDLRGVPVEGRDGEGGAGVQDGEASEGGGNEVHGKTPRSLRGNPSHSTTAPLTHLPLHSRQQKIYISDSEGVSGSEGGVDCRGAPEQDT